MNQLREFVKSYSDTYFQVKHRGNLYPFFFQETDDKSKISGLILYSENNTWEPFTIKFDMDNFNLTLPDLGLVNTINEKGKKDAYFISQIPERQWKKGLFGNKLNIINIHANKATYGSMINFPKVMWNIYNPKYYKISDFDKNNDLSIALSSRIGLSNYRDTVVATFDNQKIGYLYDGQIILLKDFWHLEKMVSKYNLCKVE